MSIFSIIDKNFLISSRMFGWWSSSLFTTFAASSSSAVENDTPTTIMSTNTKTKGFGTILLLFGISLTDYVYWCKLNSNEVETYCKIAVPWLGRIYIHLLCTCPIYEVIICFGRWWKITQIKILPSASSFKENDKNLATLSTWITLLYRYIIIIFIPSNANRIKLF